MATKRKKKNPRRQGVAKKYRGDNRKIRRAKKSGNAAKLASHKKRSHARMVKALANPEPRKSKTGRWYKGPRGVKVRVRRVRGKFVVDLKK